MSQAGLSSSRGRAASAQGGRSLPGEQAKASRGLWRRESAALLGSTAFVFLLLYGSGYLALLWLPPMQPVDTRSQLAADYSPWEDLAFQPLDLRILAEIQQERGLPGQLVVERPFWPSPTPAGKPSSSGEAFPAGQATRSSPMPVFSPRPTLSDEVPSPSETAEMETETIPTARPTSFSNPTRTPQVITSPTPKVTLEPASTPIPTAAQRQDEPTKRAKPTKKVPPPKRTPSP